MVWRNTGEKSQFCEIKASLTNHWERVPLTYLGVNSVDYIELGFKSHGTAKWEHLKIGRIKIYSMEYSTKLMNIHMDMRMHAHTDPFQTKVVPDVLQMLLPSIHCVFRVGLP